MNQKFVLFIYFSKNLHNNIKYTQFTNSLLLNIYLKIKY